jgi:hypothetical protein
MVALVDGPFGSDTFEAQGKVACLPRTWLSTRADSCRWLPWLMVPSVQTRLRPKEKSRAYQGRGLVRGLIRADGCLG